MISKKKIVIDCTHISDIPSLYCLLGEAFFGWKGYIGSNLDALDDSLINIKSNGKKNNLP
ncbi:barstar family protein [Providencia stuartii]|uniref:barstar family protein n=1 Tax=Providencia stuartii TaxID=588 RepID=UPI0034E476EC